MDWKSLFLSANGRIGRQDFWIGFAILFVAGIVLGMIPLLGFLIGLALIYPNVCVGAKRLHDMGKSGWLMLIPYGVGIIAFFIAIVMMVMAAAGAAAMDSSGFGVAAMISAAALPFGLAFLVWLGFYIWIGVTPGQPSANQYGPPASPAETFS